MIKPLLFAAFFCASLLSFTAYCEADVVDDGENFALLEEQQATYESPVAHEERSSYDNVSNREQSALAREEPALAKDDKQIIKNNSTDLLDKIQSLQQEIQELRGQLEVQAHDLKLLQEQELSFYKDLDARLRSTPARDIAKSPATELSMDTKPSTPQTALQANSATPTNIPDITPVTLPVIEKGRVNPAEEQISYLAAYDLVQRKQFDDALLAMNTFVAKYPQGGYSANAQYWLGELYMVKNNYPQAIEHFNSVLQAFPSSSKCAASLLKIGYAQAALGQTAEARQTLQSVVQKYPDTHTAKLATTKLNSLKQ